MRSNSAAIEVQGTGYTNKAGSDLNPLILTSSDSLRVKPANTLALVGSEVYLNGGVVTTDSGRIELGGVKEGLVKINSNLQGWSLDYSGLQNFGDINFDSLALADASGSGSGAIMLQGENIFIR